MIEFLACFLPFDKHVHLRFRKTLLVEFCVKFIMFAILDLIVDLRSIVVEYIEKNALRNNFERIEQSAMYSSTIETKLIESIQDPYSLHQSEGFHCKG